MDNKYKELRRNTIIIGISNLGSKAISFLLAPLYSYWMTIEQYGTMDLITTTASLLTPILCMDIFDATFRFSNDDQYDHTAVLTNSMIVAAPAFVVGMAAIIITSLRGNYIIALSTAYLLLNVATSILQQHERGRRHMMTFAVAGVTNSVFLLAFNFLFLIALRMQLYGWLISFVFGKLVETVYLLIKCDTIRHLSARYYDRRLTGSLLKFSIPLLPNAVMWWIMNLSDRYMLGGFIGAAAIGLYGAANKIPNILNIFENVFYQSWQTSAINSMKNQDRNVFYSQIFNRYFTILSVGVIGLLAISRELIIILFSSAYESAWIAMAPLIIGVLVHALSTNIGAFYISFKKTEKAFATSLAGALTNIILNFIFIPKFGIIAASATTLTGYIVTFLYRWFDIRNLVQISLDWKNCLFYISLLIIQTGLFYYPTKITLAIRLLLALLVVFKERKLLFSIVKR